MTFTFPETSGTVHTFNVSLYNLDEKTFNKIRSKKDFNIVLESIEVNGIHTLLQKCNVIDFELFDLRLTIKFKKMILMDDHKYRQFKIWSLIR